MTAHRLLARLALAASIAVAAPAVRAQAPGAEVEAEAPLLEELVVPARQPGPPWWKVSDADSTVYVLGMPDKLPKGMSWDQSVLQRRLLGADRLITPGLLRGSVSPFLAPVALFDVMDAQRSGTPLEQHLPPATMSRFEAAARRIGKSPQEYRALRPWFAGASLVRDFDEVAQLDSAEPRKAVEAAAKKARVRITPVQLVRSTTGSLSKDWRSMPDEVAHTCVQAAAAEVEAGDDVVRAAAAAWASGRTREAVTPPRGRDICYDILPSFRLRWRDRADAEAAALAEALARPGRTVAALRLRSLVAKGGVLEQLRARGFTVEVQ